MFLVILAFAEVMVFSAALSAYRDSYLTERQVRSHYGKGLPFLGHWGMWLDVLVISPLVAWITSRYEQNWHVAPVIVCVLLGMAISAYMHFGLYAKESDRKPTSMFHGGSITGCGVLHCSYMWWAIAVIMLFYFESHPTKHDAALVSIGLGLHSAVSTIQPAWHLGLKEAFNKVAISIVLGAWLLLGVAYYVVV